MKSDIKCDMRVFVSHFGKLLIMLNKNTFCTKHSLT